MKKIISIILVVIILISLIGCSKKNEAEKAGGQKTEEELRAEIRAELEAEARKNNEKAIQDTAAPEQQKSGAINTNAAADNDLAEKTADASQLKEGDTQDGHLIDSVNIRDLKVGSSLDGKEVTGINYISDMDFNFTLSGEYSFDGQLYYDEFEETFVFIPEENQTLNAKISAGEEIFELPGLFRFYVSASLKEIIGMDIYNQLVSDTNLKIDCTITVDNYGFVYHDPQVCNSTGTLLSVLGSSQAYSDNGLQGQNDINDGSALIEYDGTASGTNYFKYKANQKVYFDVDEDGMDEEILYDSKNGKLSVTGYDPFETDTFSAETESFIIIKFADKYNTVMNMIGLLDYGPSVDPVTTLYSIISPNGEKTFVSVGRVEGEIVPPADYDDSNMDDFNYKAVLLEGEGILSPVRLNIAQTWYGLSLFTYYTTYCSLVDGCKKYGQDYVTKSELDVLNSVTAYGEKDENSESVIIKAGQKVNLVLTDNKQWIAMEAGDGTSGWVLAKDVTMDNFSGLAFYD